MSELSRQPSGFLKVPPMKELEIGRKRKGCIDAFLKGTRRANRKLFFVRKENPKKKKKGVESSACCQAQLKEMLIKTIRLEVQNIFLPIWAEIVFCLWIAILPRFSLGLRILQCYGICSLDQRLVSNWDKVRQVASKFEENALK